MNGARYAGRKERAGETTCDADHGDLSREFLVAEVIVCIAHVAQDPVLVLTIRLDHMLKSSAARRRS